MMPHRKIIFAVFLFILVATLGLYASGLGDLIWWGFYYFISSFLVICNLIFQFISHPYVYPILYALTYFSALASLLTLIATIIWYSKARRNFKSPVKKSGPSSIALILVLIVATGIFQVTISIIDQNLLYSVSFYLFVVSILFLAVRTVVNISTSLAYKRKLDVERKYGLVSIVIPAFNEEKVIRDTIQSALALTYPQKEIIVVDDGSTDSTLKIARETAISKPVTVVSKPNGGKWSALNKGVESARGEIIVCIDADTRLDKDAIEPMLRHFNDPKVAAVAGNVKVGNRNKTLTKLQALEYVTSINIQRRGESCLNRITVVPGPLGAFRKSVIKEVGMYSPDTFAEDADLTLNILKAGYRIQYEPGSLGYTEVPTKLKDLAKQRYRWYRGLLQSMVKHKNMVFNSKYGLTGLFMIPWVFFNGIIFPWFTFLTLIWLLILMFNPLSGFVIYNPNPRGPPKEPPRGPPSGTPDGGGGPNNWLIGLPRGTQAAPQLIVEVNFFQAIPVIYIFWFFIFLLLEIAVAIYAVHVDVKEKPRLVLYVVLYKFFYSYIIETFRLLSHLEEGLKYPMKWETVGRIGDIDEKRVI